MTEPAPWAQTQYLPQRWHIEVRMHYDLESPDQTYVVAEISKKVGLASTHTWLGQDRYDWIQGEPMLPEPGRSFHCFMVEALDHMREWLLSDLKREVEAGKRTEIRPELGVSLPPIPHQAG